MFKTTVWHNLFVEVTKYDIKPVEKVKMHQNSLLMHSNKKFMRNVERSDLTAALVIFCVRNMASQTEISQFEGLIGHHEDITGSEITMNYLQQTDRWQHKLLHQKFKMQDTFVTTGFDAHHSPALIFFWKAKRFLHVFKGNAKLLDRDVGFKCFL